jgi:hypothetical protein
MSGLSTKDVKTGGGLPKIIEPGNQVVKINAIKLDQQPFMVNDNGYQIILDVETKPIENFEGFLTNPDDPTSPRYEGQIGSVKTSRFYYKDGQTKTGIAVSRDIDILKQLKFICLATDNNTWWEAADGKFDTIEEFVEAFNKEKPFAGKFLNMCIAGKEYANKAGYISHDLFLPKFVKGRVLFEAETATPSKVVTFNEADHIIVLEETPAATDPMEAGSGTELPSAGDFPTDVKVGPAPFEL